MNMYQTQQSFTIKQTDITPILYVVTAALWCPSDGRHQIETSLIYRCGDDEVETLQKKIHGSSFGEDGFNAICDYAKMFHKRLSGVMIKKNKLSPVITVYKVTKTDSGQYFYCEVSDLEYFFDGMDAGEEFLISVEQMTKEKFDSFPEFDGF